MTKEDDQYFKDELKELMKPSGLKIGTTMRSKVHGREFTLDRVSLHHLENDNMGEWWNNFEVVKEKNDN